MEKTIHQLNIAFGVFFSIVLVSLAVLIMIKPDNAVGSWLFRNWIFSMVLFAVGFLSVASLLRNIHKKPSKNPYRKPAEEIDTIMLMPFLDKQ